MIYGETGTGKELFAQAIHSHSPRKDRPYVAINCAAIPDNLLEGMLFGTSRGAFTGAIDKAGIFETADGGTLFLDEINSMSPGLQVKLLRFLQERKVRRVGAMTEIDVDLKIISSVNTMPQLAIDAGLLRSDLFYRLAVVFIQIPPLRDRMGDLNRLITHFLVKINMNLDKRVTGIATDVLGQFERYDWPGNVRELEHVIEGAMNMVGDKKTIEMRHLSVSLPVDNPASFQADHPVSVRTDNRRMGAASFSPPSITRNTDRLNGSLSVVSEKTFSVSRTLAEEKADHEIALIQSALTATQGNAARAARKLGISPQSLNYKLKRFGIDRQAYRFA
jgi:arginine utilization regulatory protein